MEVFKSPESDGIYPRILREAREGTAGALTKIFASSLITGEGREDWWVANVVLLFKKGSRENPGKYRAANFMSVVGKLLERILLDRVYSHLEKNALFRDSHHGFVGSRSCLVVFFEVVTKVLDEGSVADVDYLDFTH